MPFNRQIKQADTITTERVSATLEHDGFRLKSLNDRSHHGFEGVLIGHIIDSVVHREVYGVIFACLSANIIQGSCPWEVIAILVERCSEDAISCQESLLNSIAVMAVNVYVQDALVCLKELKDAQDTVIDVAEAASLELLGVMEATGPINCDIRLISCKFCASKESSCCVTLAVLVHIVKYGAIAISEAVGSHLVGIAILLVHSDALQAVNVVVRVEVCQVNLIDVSIINADLLHLVEHVVDSDQGVGHLDTKWFHRMCLTDLEYREVLVVVVTRARFACRIASTKCVVRAS